MTEQQPPQEPPRRDERYGMAEPWPTQPTNTTQAFTAPTTNGAATAPFHAYPLPKPPKKRRWLPFVAYPAVFIAGVAIGAAGGDGTASTSTDAPDATVTVTTTAPAAEPAATTTSAPAAPAYTTPKPKDIKLTMQTRTKQCFGSAGCNVTYQVEAAWSLMFDPAVTYDVTYEVRGGEDGPVINTMTVTGDEYQRPSEEMVSTSSKNAKLTAVVTRVEAQG